jgi:hypothetical protein
MKNKLYRKNVAVLVVLEALFRFSSYCPVMVGAVLSYFPSVGCTTCLNQQAYLENRLYHQEEEEEE